MPKADATGLAPEKSAEQNPPALSSAPEGFLLCAASPISMVKSRSGGLGHSNAKTARRALQILRLLGPGGIPPKPIAKLRNSPGNNVRISGGKSVTRYTLQPLEQRLGFQPRTLLDLPLDCVPHLAKRILPRPPMALPLQLAGQPFQAQIPPRRRWVHPRLRRRNLLILFRIRQLSQPPHLLVCDHPLALNERDSRWSH